jgi:hypothetical protein
MSRRAALRPGEFTVIERQIPLEPEGAVLGSIVVQ